MLASLNGIAGILEVFGGFALVLGLLTRPIAFLLSGEMAVAYFLRHAPRDFWPIMNRGEVPVLLSFVFLYLAFAGGGRWSIDALLARATRGHAEEIQMSERRVRRRRAEDRQRVA